MEGERIATGDTETVNWRLYPGLVRVAFLLSGSADEAHDLTHDVFVRAGSRGVEWAQDRGGGVANRSVGKSWGYRPSATTTVASLLLTLSQIGSFITSINSGEAT